MHFFAQAYQRKIYELTVIVPLEINKNQIYVNIISRFQNPALHLCV